MSETRVPNCPYCTSGEVGFVTCTGESNWWQVRCGTCEMRGPSGVSRQQAIDAWAALRSRTEKEEP